MSSRTAGATLANCWHPSPWCGAPCLSPTHTCRVTTEPSQHWSRVPSGRGQSLQDDTTGICIPWLAGGGRGHHAGAYWAPVCRVLGRAEEDLGNVQSTCSGRPNLPCTLLGKPWLWGAPPVFPAQGPYPCLGLTVPLPEYSLGKPPHP